MPMWLLRVFENALPQLRAQEALMEVTVALIGSGNMKKGDRARTLNRWKRDASQGVPRAHKLPVKDVARKFGIPIIPEEKKDGS